MSAIFALTSLLLFFAAMYSVTGVLFPSLPGIRTRWRAVRLTAAGLALSVAAGVASLATASPEARQAAAERRQAEAQKQETERRRSEAEAAARQRAEDAASTVPIGTLIGDYQENELAADAKYKGRQVRVSGIVGDVKNDILGHPYVLLGTGDEDAIRQVQCSLDKSATSEAAALRKGQTAMVRGTVRGLMLHVQMNDCQLVP
jgi:hypothetical protein